MNYMQLSLADHSSVTYSTTFSTCFLFSWCCFIAIVMISRIDRNGSLWLYNLTEEHEGLYACQAENNFGKLLSEFIEVDVTGDYYWTTIE